MRVFQFIILVVILICMACFFIASCVMHDWSMMVISLVAVVFLIFRIENLELEGAKESFGDVVISVCMWFVAFDFFIDPYNVRIFWASFAVLCSFPIFIIRDTIEFYRKVQR